MAERLTPERRFLRDEIDVRGPMWAENRMETFIARLMDNAPGNGGLGWGSHYHVDMADLLAGYRAQQAEIDLLTAERDAYKATADDLSQRDADWRAEVDRLRALLCEAREALRHVETDMWLDCCRNAIAPVLAKLAQEGLS